MSGNLIAGVLFFTFLVYITTRGQLPAYLALFMPTSGSVAPQAATSGYVAPQAATSGYVAPQAASGVPVSDGSLASTADAVTGGDFLNPDAPSPGPAPFSWSSLPPGTVPFKIPGSNQTLDFPNP